MVRGQLHVLASYSCHMQMTFVIIAFSFTFTVVRLYHACECAQLKDNYWTFPWTKERQVSHTSASWKMGWGGMGRTGWGGLGWRGPMPWTLHKDELGVL